MLDVRRLRVLREVARRGSLAGAADVLLALHRDHPLADKEDIRLEDLVDETWIDVPVATSGGQTAARACARAGVVPRAAFGSDDYTAIRELVGAGAGLHELAVQLVDHLRAIEDDLGHVPAWR